MPIPTTIKLHRKSRSLELGFGDDENYTLSCELLRVCSPSAEVRGHGKGQEVLQTGKLNVNIDEIKPVGNYAVQLCFDDGHNTGLFSWDYLHELCVNKERYWGNYLKSLDEAGAIRDPEVQVIRLDLPTGD
jgi:DUF971 family protein